MEEDKMDRFDDRFSIPVVTTGLVPAMTAEGSGRRTVLEPLTPTVPYGTVRKFLEAPLEWV